MSAGQHHEATFFGQLSALIRRNVLLKWRIKSRTLAELLLPLYFLLILYIIQIAIPTTKSPVQDTEGAEVSVSSAFHPQVYSLAVGPASSASRDLMENWVLPSWQQFSGGHDFNITWFDTVDELSTAADNRAIDSAVVFNEEPTDSLNITIRMMSSAVPQTSSYTISSAYCRSGASATGLQSGSDCPADKYVDSGFVELQALFHYSWIQKIGNGVLSTNPLELQLQLMPKDEYTGDNLVVMRALLPLFVTMGMSQCAPSLLLVIVAEKERKIKEAMRVMGVSDGAYWLSWCLVYFVLELIVSVVVTIVAGLALGAFSHSNLFIIFLLIFLYAMSVVFLAFALTPFFNKAQVAGTVGAFAVMFTSLLYYVQVFVTDSSVVVFWLLSLISPAAIGLALDQALVLDVSGQGATFSTLWDSSDGAIPLAGSLIMLSVDVVLYISLAYYFDSVWPSEYGTQRRPWFCFQPSFWFPSYRRGQSTVDVIDANKLDGDPADVEPVTEDMKPHLAVKIRNLHKTFKKWRQPPVNAVNGISLDMYENQITAILGHNGAGKTTLINVLTGLTSSTSGSVSVYNLDISNDPNALWELRKMIGLCPQQDILFDELTPREHLRFFGRARGMSGVGLENEIHDMLKELGLLGRADTRSVKLSGGQKRKLSVGIALIGDPKIIILDEPTAGVDPYSRRRLWKVLQNRKQGRIVLLTTHFMEEADVLAERKAVVSRGRLRCCGSSLFLKRRFGVGYHLRMATIPHALNENILANVIISHVPGAERDRQHGRELSYVLPLASSDSFPELFRALDEQLTVIGIQSYGVSMTTLEEVFLHLGQMEEEQELIEKEGTANTHHHDHENKDTFKLPELKAPPKRSSWQTYKTLVKLRVTRYRRDPAALFFMVFMPLVFSVLGLYITTLQTVPTEQAPLLLDASVYSTTPNNILYSNLTNGANLDPVLTALSSELLPALLNEMPRSYDGNDFASILDDVPPYVIAGYDFKSFDDADSGTNVRIRYNDTYVHTIPVSVFLIMDAIQQVLVDATSTVQIWTQPFLDGSADNQGFNGGAFGGSMIVGMSFMMIPASLVIDMVYDREIKAKNQLRVNGLPTWLYFTSYLTVLGCVMLFVCIVLLIIIQAFQLEQLTTEPAFGILAVLYILYCPVSILCACSASYLFNKMETAQSVYPNVTWFVGFLPYVAVAVLDMLETGSDAATILHCIFSFLDPFYQPFAILYYVNKVGLDCLGDTTCSGTLSDYMTTEIVVLFVALIVLIPIYSILLIIIDVKKTSGNVSDVFRCLSQSKTPAPKQKLKRQFSAMSAGSVAEDDDVAQERLAIDNYLERRAEMPGGLSENDPVVLVHQLRKEFKLGSEEKNICRRRAMSSADDGTVRGGRKVAVADVSFCVAPGEVFGLLGHNGAGKTTTMRMIIAEENTTAGRVQVAGHEVLSSLSEGFRHLGYCPQHDALWKNMTVKEHIEVYAAVRGILPSDIPKVADGLIRGLRLDEHSNIQAQKCSGGTKRKLSFALSVLASPLVVLLDEPSAGMDPRARRFLWDVVTATFGEERGALLTTHSMEEADALCAKIGIMVKGRLRCIGSTQHLKDKYGAGYTLEIKWKGIQHDIDVQREKREGLLRVLFPSATREESFGDRTVLAVPQRDVISLATVFQKLQDERDSLGIAEYSFSQTTLEQVFLRFAKEQEGDSDDEDEEDAGRPHQNGHPFSTTL